jgi:hypothetical protein
MAPSAVAFCGLLLSGNITLPPAVKSTYLITGEHPEMKPCAAFNRLLGSKILGYKISILPS